MSTEKYLKLTFRWEGLDADRNYTVDERQLEMNNLKEAVNTGVSRLALYFRDAATPQGPRHFTNVFKLADAAGVIQLLEDLKAFRMEPHRISRLFSRVSETAAEQKKYDDIKTLDDAITRMKAEPATSVFVAPSNGGFVKVEKGDIVYDKKGSPLWPTSKAPSPGFILNVSS